jgi:hypothetical protein
MATIDNSGKVAYIYSQADNKWYSIAGTVNPNASYTWTANQQFSAPVNFDMVINAKAGVNNFANPTARDSALVSPTNGLVCFVRQTNAGSVINQIQYYHNGEWRWIGDSADLSLKTSSFTITKDDAGKTLNVSSSSDVVVTIPANSTTPFINGQKVEIVRTGIGNVSIEGAVGVTINSKNSNKKISSQYVGCVLVKIDTNTWLLIGDLTA